jgi:hypothetical protein
MQMREIIRIVENCIESPELVTEEARKMEIAGQDVVVLINPTATETDDSRKLYSC